MVGPGGGTSALKNADGDRRPSTPWVSFVAACHSQSPSVNVPAGKPWAGVGVVIQPVSTAHSAAPSGRAQIRSADSESPASGSLNPTVNRLAWVVEIV